VRRSVAALAVAATAGIGVWALVDTGVIGGSSPVPVVLFGDSLAAQAAPYLTFILGLNGDATVEAHTLGGTAVCDWLPTMRQVASSEHPAAVVLEFSGNALTACMHGYTPYTASYWAKYAGDMSRAVALFSGAARVYIVGYPISAAQALAGPPMWDRLNQIYAALAARQAGHVTFVDAGTAVEGPRGTYTGTLPCLAHEPCTGPVVGGVPTNVVRAPDGAHFCPTSTGNANGQVGRCDAYSSGAFRYASAIAAPIRADFDLR
jgi:hypothetical protein